MRVLVCIERHTDERNFIDTPVNLINRPLMARQPQAGARLPHEKKTGRSFDGTLFATMSLSSHDPPSNNYSMETVYRDKCTQLEKSIKEMLFLNAAYESEIHTTQLKLARERADRNILLHKLMAFEKISPIESTLNKLNSTVGSNNVNSSNVSAIEESNKILSSMLSKKNSAHHSNSGKVPPVPTLASLTTSTATGKKKRTTSADINQ